MSRPSVPCLAVFALLALSSGIAKGATFTYTVNCPTDTTVGPITVLAGTGTASVTLAPGVVTTIGLLPTNQNTLVNNLAAAGGTYTGTLNCTLTFGGVATNFSRSFSLDVPPLPSPPNQAIGILTTGAVSFTVDLGAQGRVDISAPVDMTVGFNRGTAIIVVPFTANTSLLLHDVPVQSAVSVPLPHSMVLNLIGVIMLGLFLTQRARRKKSARTSL